MGARAKRTTKKNAGHQDGSASQSVAEVPLPRCVTQLQSSNYGELEEACGDLTFYATQAKHHASLLRAGVPQRLAELLSRPPLDPNADPQSTPVLARIHQAILNFQISAAEALRNCITNSNDDEAIDALAGHPFSAATGEQVSYSAVLLSSLFGTWSLITEVRAMIPPGEHLLAACNAAEEEEQEQEQGGSSTTASTPATVSSTPEELRSVRRAIRLYFTLLHFHEQLLQLIVVSVDGSEEVATALSQPRVTAELLRQLEVCTTEANKTLQRIPSIYEELNSEFVDAEHHSGSYPFFRQESLLLVHLAAALSESLHTLSTDNTTLAASFSNLVQDGDASGVSVAQKNWLDSVVDGTAQSAWLSTQRPEITPNATVLQLQREWMLHHLLQATLAIQGTLINLFPSEENVKRVLPLSVQVLSVYMPIQQWRCALPLLKETCELPEDLRSSGIRLITSRLRVSKVAVDVLSSCVSFVCEQNSDEDDDEVAFRKNPLSALLFQTNALHVFGSVLKDALWMQETAGSNEWSFDALRQSEQRALRLAAQSNSEVTTMQFVILSAEVGVWNLASSLLLMVSADTLGEVSLIWKAMISAVQNRGELIRLAYLKETSDAYGKVLEPGAELYSVATESPAARHLLWLQLKSLLQILWTLQRKQSTVQGSYLDCPNTLGASPTDVDLLTRLAWERESPPALCQASVATVGYLCSTFQSPDAISVGARFAIGMLLNAGGQQKSLSELENHVIQTGAPTPLRERHAWLSRLQRADEFVSARCEAANTLIDMFSDERYDAAVYVPLGIQSSLNIFFQQLKTHLGARQRVSKELWKNYRVQAPPAGLPAWMEVAENLEGFLPYKKKNAGV